MRILEVAVLQFYFNTTSVLIKLITLSIRWILKVYFNTTSVLIKHLFLFSSLIHLFISIQLLFLLNMEEIILIIGKCHFNTTSVLIKPSYLRHFHLPLYPLFLETSTFSIILPAIFHNSSFYRNPCIYAIHPIF